MARSDNLHSQIVAGMKILLPLAALGLLSTLFLISRSIDPSKSALVAEIDLSQKAKDLGATNPRFSGVTEHGDAILFTATRALPDRDTPERLAAENFTAQFRLAAGTVIDITALAAHIHRQDMTAILQEQVHVLTSTGYVLDTERLETRLDEVFAKSPGPVTATGPLGHLIAGQMLLHDKTATNTPELLFSGGVRLIYIPKVTRK
ncbi:MAG: hypothetical protein COW54_09700 [Rhodobacteraceae bacterium CG17_big_fil_post_rev_8_21_14_2_50_63_15]|nr:hypothetical protein [Roseovarius sp.]PIV78402.1 MAG: hypothetical protein COW54_09700 [Rhodobacteraceae bacterium CG17_big_fil_post_rev_8_21_14_2_50_63_15]